MGTLHFDGLLKGCGLSGNHAWVESRGITAACVLLPAPGKPSGELCGCLCVLHMYLCCAHVFVLCTCVSNKACNVLCMCACVAGKGCRRVACFVHAPGLAQVN
jgi:hypothetical protein